MKIYFFVFFAVPSMLCTHDLHVIPSMCILQSLGAAGADRRGRLEPHVLDAFAYLVRRQLLGVVVHQRRLLLEADLDAVDPRRAAEIILDALDAALAGHPRDGHPDRVVLGDGDDDRLAGREVPRGGQQRDRLRFAGPVADEGLEA
jgi:hypothetical protein